MAAASQVFSITELLEDVLIRVPPKDVLLLQRVCRGWKNTIKGSLKLQRLLFFRPAGEITDKPVRASYLNPMIEPLLNHFRYAGKPGSHLLFRRNASWTGLYLSQPPLKTLMVLDAYSTFRMKITRESGITLYDFYHCSRSINNRHCCSKVDLEETLVWFREMDNYGQLERLSK